MPARQVVKKNGEKKTGSLLRPAEKMLHVCHPLLLLDSGSVFDNPILECFAILNLMFAALMLMLLATTNDW